MPTVCQQQEAAAARAARATATYANAEQGCHLPPLAATRHLTPAVHVIVVVVGHV